MADAEHLAQGVETRVGTVELRAHGGDLLAELVEARQRGIGVDLAKLGCEREGEQVDAGFRGFGERRKRFDGHARHSARDARAP